MMEGLNNTLVPENFLYITKHSYVFEFCTIYNHGHFVIFCHIIVFPLQYITKGRTYCVLISKN